MTATYNFRFLWLMMDHLQESIPITKVQSEHLKKRSHVITYNQFQACAASLIVLIIALIPLLKF